MAAYSLQRGTKALCDQFEIAANAYQAHLIEPETMTSAIKHFTKEVNEYLENAEEMDIDFGQRPKNLLGRVSDLKILIFWDQANFERNLTAQKIEEYVQQLDHLITNSPTVGYVRDSLYHFGKHLLFLNEVQRFSGEKTIDLNPKVPDVFHKLAQKVDFLDIKTFAEGHGCKMHHITLGSQDYALKEYIKGDQKHEEVIKAHLQPHPNIAKTVLIDWDRKHSVSPLATGDLLSIKRFDDEAHAFKVFQDIASALVHMHTKGVINRDIKPENILVFKDGHCEVTDFDHSEFKSKLNSTRIKGTKPFIAPEGWYRDLPIDEKIDIFALGITIYDMLVGGHEEMERYHANKQAPLQDYIWMHNSRISKFIERNIDPKIAANPDSKMWPLIRQCVMPYPEDRPTAAEALSVID